MPDNRSVDNPRPRVRQTRRELLGRLVALGAGFMLGRGSDQMMPQGEKPIVPTQERPAQEGPINTEKLPLAPKFDCTLALSGYSETSDPNGRIKEAAPSQEAGSYYDSRGRLVLRGLPYTLANVRLSPDGEWLLGEAVFPPKVGSFEIGDAVSMYDPNPPSALVVARPGPEGKKLKGFRIPSRQVAFDSSGRVFVYTAGNLTNLGEIAIDPATGSFSVDGGGKPIIEVHPAVRIYDPNGGFNYPIMEETLSRAGDPLSFMNRYWAQLLSSGATDRLEVFIQRGRSRDQIAVTPDSKWVCVPARESFYLKEGDKQKSIGGIAGIENLLILELTSGADKGRPTINPESFIRVSTLERPDLNDNSKSVEVVGVTGQGQFLVAFAQEEQGRRGERVLLGMIKPKEKGDYEIRYVSLPKQVTGIDRRMEGVFLHFTPTSDKYLSVPFLSNDQLSQLASMSSGSVCRVENGLLRLDSTVPGGRSSSQSVTPKSTPTPEPLHPRKMI